MNQREKRLALITGVVIGGGLLFTQVIEPTVTQHQELSEQRERLEGLLERERALAGRAATLVKRKREVWATLTPPAETSLVPWLMEHVRAEAAAAGFKPASLRFVSARPLGEGKGRKAVGRGATKEPFLEVRLELRARVRFKELSDFLCRLASSDRHVRVRSLDLSPRKEGDQVDVQLELVALAPRESYKGLDEEAIR